MKKTIFFLTSIALLIALYASAPYLTNRSVAYIINSDTTTITVDSISPWETVATITVNDENLNLFIPRLIANYQTDELSKRNISNLDLQGGSIIILDSVASSDADTKFSIPPALLEIVNDLPISVNKINIKNLHVFVEKLDLNLFLNGTVTIKTEDDINKVLREIGADLLISGDLKSELIGKITLLTDGFTTNLQTEHQLASIKKFLPLATSSSLNGNLTINTQIQSDYDLQTPTFSINIAGTPRLVDSSYSINPTSEKIAIDAEGDLNNVAIKISTVKIATPIASQVTATANLNLQDESFTSKVDLKIDDLAKNIEITNTGSKDKINTQISLPKEINFEGIRISGNNKINATTTLATNNITTKITGAIQKIQHDDLTTKKVKFTENISYKNSTLTTNGKLNINQIMYQNNYLANLALQHTLKENKISFKSTIVSAIKNFNIKCDGNYELTGNGTGKCQAIGKEISEMDLPPFLQEKLPENLQFSAAINLNSEFSINESPTVKTSVEIENGQVNLGDDLKISDLNTKITVPDLLREQSLPSQEITISQLNAGAINISNFKANYRLENFHSLFLENSIFNWAGGLVESNSLRVDTTNDKYALTLYCDRINLSQILSQFGIPDASGNGSLNGRLPITWSEGKFKFDDGFLFSSPGKSGIVKFTDTEYLKKSLGDNIDAPYMNYSMDAMGNFQYNWASLQFNTQDDSLLVAMSLDGKPAMPLPYAYQSGNIVYKEDGSGLQHPLNLSINFKLPLTEILRYGQTFQSIME